VVFSATRRCAPRSDALGQGQEHGQHEERRQQEKQLDGSGAVYAGHFDARIMYTIN